MQDSLKENNINISFLELIRVIWRRKFQIIILSFLISFLNIFYALSLSNVYTAEAELAPNHNTESNLGAFSRLGGIASLAGIDSNMVNRINNYNVTVRSITSKQFLSEFIDRHDLYKDIYAISSYDIDSDTIYYDDTVYDQSSSSWVRKVKKPYKPKPSAYEVREVLIKKLTITQDTKMGLLYLNYTHPNPKFAKELLDKLIHDINLYMKERDIAFYSRIATSLIEEISKTEDMDLKESLYSLVEINQRKLSIANASNEYALKIIDEPIVPEKKSYPFRSRLVIILSLIGGIFSTVLLVTHDYLNKFGYKRIFDLIR
jgi:uncharacterized protein involved in exopolysaccharide biosynthesis